MTVLPLRVSALPQVLPKTLSGGHQGTERGRALPKVTQLQSLVLGASWMGGRTGHLSEPSRVPVSCVLSSFPGPLGLALTSRPELAARAARVRGPKRWPQGGRLLRQIPKRGLRAGAQ